MKRGFTLVEILVAVMITTILVAMAVPMYEKTIEKSRMADARTTLKRIYDSKTRMMEDMELSTYSPSNFGFENLDYTFRCTHGTTSSNGHVVKCATEDFTYVLNPSGSGTSPYVCAARRKGDNIGVNFLYGVYASGSNKGKPFFLCNKASVTEGCEAYGLQPATGSAWCTPGVDSVPSPGGGATPGV